MSLFTEGVVAGSESLSAPVWFVIVKLLVSVAGDADKTPDIIDCANCFLNGTDNCKITKSK